VSSAVQHTARNGQSIVAILHSVQHTARDGPSIVAIARAVQHTARDGPSICSDRTRRTTHCAGWS
jgi:hypothetical protein